jgi:type VI secretion system secreted protein Hcp
MANNFLELTHVLGESLDHEHKMAIEIHDWSWSIENRAPYRLQQSDATKQTSVAHITVEKWVDKATTTLTNYCANGKHIDEGIITCRKNAGESQVEFLIITLKHVKVGRERRPHSRNSRKRRIVVPALRNRVLCATQRHR